MPTTLVINFGSSLDKGFLIEEKETGLSIRKKVELLSCKDAQSATFFIKKIFHGQFDENLVIENELEAITQTLKELSLSGEVLLIEIGSAKSILGIGSYGRVELRVEEMGLGSKIEKILQKRETVSILRWMPHPIKFESVDNFLGNKSIYPGLKPASIDELDIEQAVACEIIKFLKEKYWPASRNIPKKVILSGAVFSHAPKAYQPLLTFLNGFEPTGFIHVYRDPHNAIAVYGALILETNEKIINIFDNFESLGDVISLNHSKKEGEDLGEVSLDLGFVERQRLILRSGQLLVVPFSDEQNGKVLLNLDKGVDFEGIQDEIRLIGGPVGIVIDGRGRPIPKPQLDTQSKEMVKKWHQAMDYR